MIERHFPHNPEYHGGRSLEQAAAIEKFCSYADDTVEMHALMEMVHVEQRASR